MTRFVRGEARGQSTLFPECLDDFIAEDNPVRAIEALGAFGCLLTGRVGGGHGSISPQRVGC